MDSQDQNILDYCNLIKLLDNFYLYLNKKKESGSKILDNRFYVNYQKCKKQCLEENENNEMVFNEQELYFLTKMQNISSDFQDFFVNFIDLDRHVYSPVVIQFLLSQKIFHSLLEHF